MESNFCSFEKGSNFHSNGMSLRTKVYAKKSIYFPLENKKEGGKMFVYGEITGQIFRIAESMVYRELGTVSEGGIFKLPIKNVFAHRHLGLSKVLAQCINYVLHRLPRNEGGVFCFPI